MKKIDTIENEIDQIRIDIYERTRNMSLHEFQDYFTSSAEEAAKEYGFTISKPLEETDGTDSKKSLRK
jgi:hypothetical protein